METVKVVVRCRPLSDQEKRDGRARVVEIAAGGQVSIKSDTEGVKQFTFDQAYAEDSSQGDLYHGTAAPLVEAVLQGYNGTIFAFGQTGCGKTFTMEGLESPPEAHGIIPRAFRHIFSEIQKGSGGQDYLVRVSHLEVYNEEIRDLLSKDPKAKLELREAPERGVYVRGLREFVVKSAEEMTAVLQVGKKNRSVGATLMNQDSSRSHSIFSIVVETIGKGEGGPGAGNDSGSGGGGSAAGAGVSASPSKQLQQSQQQRGGQIRVGKLHLVDLAGSERQAKTQATGDRLREATKINLSLSALGNVIAALTEGAAQHIPYRDSKLTRLLQDSLGGNAKTVMIANVGPADYNYEESLSTLRYAARAKFIRNKPHVNEDPKDAMLREFQEEISRLKRELAARQAGKAGGPACSAAMAAAAEGAAGAPQTAHQPDARLAVIKDALREDILHQLQQAASLEALQRARQVAEEAAQKRLEAELAVKHASQEEQQRAAATKEVRKAELVQYLAATEAEQQERLMLEQRIRAMESKLLRGGENLLDKVEALEAAAVRTQAALAEQRAQQVEQERRIAQLEEANIMLEGKYSSVQEEISEKSKKLAKIAQATMTVQKDAKQLAQDCQLERERLLQDIRALTKQIKLKDLVIAAYIPSEYQSAIMSKCHWEDSQQRWAVDHIECAGNLVRARREAEASLSGSETSSGSAAGGDGSGDLSDLETFGAGNFFHGEGGLSDVYFSYKAETPSHKGSIVAGSSGAGALAGRPRTAAMQARQSRPASGALGRQWG